LYIIFSFQLLLFGPNPVLIVQDEIDGKTTPERVAEVHRYRNGKRRATVRSAIAPDAPEAV